MPDLQRIGRNGPGPQSFTGRQHHQQKPVGSCLTFKQLNRPDGFPLGNSAGKSQQLKQHGKSQQLKQYDEASDDPQHFEQFKQLGSASG